MHEKVKDGRAGERRVRDEKESNRCPDFSLLKGGNPSSDI
jgi:hypothetical protein